MKDVKVIVATHKKYQMPTDEMYMPIHVGAEGKQKIEDYKRDNEGKNISNKNPYYCELTGLYWAWKNLNADYVGLVHYRRYLSNKKKLPKEIDGRIKSVLDYKETDEILENTNIILPKRRKYYIENLYDHYKHTMYIEPLDETRKVLEEKYPEYLEEFDKLHKRTSAHMFNMFIMKKDILDKYCEWLFDILFEVEKRIPPIKYEQFHARYPGRISELLFDVWINTNELDYKEINSIDIEKVNWFKKGTSFLISKFIGKKYDKSF